MGGKGVKEFMFFFFVVTLSGWTLHVFKSCFWFVCLFSILYDYFNHCCFLSDIVAYQHHTLVASVWNQRIHIVKRINKET